MFVKSDHQSEEQARDSGGISERSSLPYRRPVLIASLVIVPIALMLLLSSSSARAQDAKPGEKKPEQTALSMFTEPFQHTDDPAFAYQIPPNKKFKKYTEVWRKVDLETRRATGVANIEKAIEAEQAKPAPDEMRLIELKSQKGQTERFYDRTKLLLEVEGNPNEFIRIEVVPLTTTKVKIAEKNPRAAIESRWSRVEVQYDQNKTTTADRKKNRQSHSLMLTGTPENSTEHGWWRFETRLLPSNDGTKTFQLSYVHRMDASKFDKKTMKDAEILSRFLIIP